MPYKIYQVVVFDNGTREWRDHNDLLHREDGPAVEYADGVKHYYLHGNKLTEEVWKEKLNLAKPHESKTFEVTICAEGEYWRLHKKNETDKFIISDGIKYRLVKAGEEVPPKPEPPPIMIKGLNNKVNK